MSRRGALIAFEGPEGSGKSTQVELLAVALRGTGQRVRTTREPGGTALGTRLRHALLHADDEEPAPLTELLLYLADRAQHLARIVRPALAAGEIVLTDRFSASTIAYQAYGRGLDLAMVKQLDALVRDGLVPDLTLLLDCPVAVGLARASEDDRFHRTALAFHERVREGFLTEAKLDPARVRVLDATRDPGHVHTEILQLVHPFMAAA